MTQGQCNLLKVARLLYSPNTVFFQAYDKITLVLSFIKLLQKVTTVEFTRKCIMTYKKMDGGRRGEPVCLERLF